MQKPVEDFKLSTRSVELQNRVGRSMNETKITSSVERKNKQFEPLVMPCLIDVFHGDKATALYIYT